MASIAPVTADSMPKRESDPGTLGRALAILEVVAEHGGATAREVSAELLIPLPTVYRLLQDLVKANYLVHLKREQRFELGYRLHDLGMALHQQIGVSANVRLAVKSLHLTSEMAAYYAVYRGSEVIVAYVSDCAQHPRARPLDFGFHEAAHATAFGKVMLAGMSPEERRDYLQARGMPSFTPHTITELDALEDELRAVAIRGIAWENEEFLPGLACGAVAVHNPSGAIAGAVAVSAGPVQLSRSRRQTDHLLREHANQLARGIRQSGRAPQQRSLVH